MAVVAKKLILKYKYKNAKVIGGCNWKILTTTITNKMFEIVAKNKQNL
jgi:hypothetical protein